MENIIKEIDKMVKSQARKFIDESETYREARQKLRSNSLSMRHGDLGHQIDLAILREIEHEAFTQPVKPLLETNKR